MIAIIGGAGWIGRAILHELAVRKYRYSAPFRSVYDVRDYRPILTFLRSIEATLVINCAGYTGRPNIDSCELETVKTMSANVLIPTALCCACADARIPLMHVSSGCIYHGLRQIFSEDTPPNPQSFYTTTKALAETTITTLANECGHYIVRIRMPLDNISHPRNYMTKLLTYERVYEGGPQSITCRPDFAAACLDLWDKRAPFGIYNMTNPGPLTAHDIVELIKESGLKRDFQFWKNDEEFYSQAATARRSTCILDTTKLESVGIRMRPAREAVIWSLENWVNLAQVEPTIAAVAR